MCSVGRVCGFACACVPVCGRALIGVFIGACLCAPGGSLDI